MGIRRNFMFSTVLTVSNYIFPFIVYPYVSRVLGVNNIGICNFVDSLINYASMVALMGISIVGVRDIAKVRHDPERLAATFTSLMLLCAVFTVIASLALVTATFAVSDLAPYRSLVHIGLLKLWGNFLLIDWLYRGLEDFRYITVRTILVKLAYMAAVFLLVRRASDYGVYFTLVCLSVAVNAALNCFRAAGIVRLRLDWQLTRRLARPFLVLGVYLLLNSMYTTYNVIYLGLEWGDTQVGYYTTSTKLFMLILAVYTAYSGVVMPRASALLSGGRVDEFRAMIEKSIQGLLLFSVPVSVFAMLYAPGIILTISGEGYEGAIPSMTIVMPLIFVIGYEQILVVQTLTPLASDRVILFNSVVGATVGVAGNFLLVGRLASVGSAIVWVAAEIMVLVCAQYFVKRRIGLSFPSRGIALNICAYAPYVLISYLVINHVDAGPVGQMLLGAAVLAVYFVLVQAFVLRNSLFVEYSAKVARAVSKRLTM